MTITTFLDEASRILFFTGKGGVGKTSLACATGVRLAKRGKRVLLVSTDPASNLDEVLGLTLSSDPTAVPGAAGLFASNINPEAAAAAYRERVIGPYRGVLPACAIAAMEEQLSGACTVEIAAFDEFTKLLGACEATANFDHVIFDTAPTGHTIRLLKLPAAWTAFIETNTTGTSCLGPLAGLETQKELYAASLHTLANGSTTSLVVVSRPEKSALDEADRTRAELAASGMRRQILIVNGGFRAHDRSDQAALALEARHQRALAEMPKSLSVLPTLSVPMSARAPMGVEGLDALLGDNTLPQRLRDGVLSVQPKPAFLDLVNAIEKGGRGVVLAMGKGGVGKTTIAAAIAVELADRGHSVRLSTTDPAAHVLSTVASDVPGLSISRIDPAAETARYTAEVLATAGNHLDGQGRALLEEDLRSPCTEEIAVFRAFAETVAADNTEFVVLDTAPTGHTLLLLDAAEAYHREVTRKLSDFPGAVRELLPRLRDPKYTRVIIVTVPEATPVHEAARLQADLQRAGISTYAWLVNQSLAVSRVSDPLLRSRGALEIPFIQEVETGLASRFAVVPWRPMEPVGAERLRDLVHGTSAGENE